MSPKKPHLFQTTHGNAWAAFQRRVHVEADSPTPVRLGVIGCGAHAVRAHQVTEQFRLVALFDRDAKTAAAFPGAKGATVYKSQRALLADPDVEAVVIASPDEHHAPQALAALRAGKHVLAEKPLATSRAQAELVRQAIDLSQKRALVFVSRDPLQFDPRLVYVRRNLAEWSSMLGKPVRYEFSFAHAAPPVNERTGLLLDHLPHELTLMEFILGPSDFSLDCSMNTSLAYGVSGTRSDGVAFSFSGVNGLADRSTFQEKLEITLQNGAVTVRENLSLIQISGDRRLGDATISPNTPEMRYQLIMRNWYQAIRRIGPAYLDRRALLVAAIPAVEMLETGQPVEFRA